MKKILSLMLSLLLLALPALGYASGDYITEALDNGRRAQVTVTFGVAEDLTGDETVDTVIRDVLEAIELRGAIQKGEGAQFSGALNLSDTDVLTLEAGRTGEAYYVLSNLLGERAIELHPEDAHPLMNRFVDFFAQMGLYSESEAEALKELLPEAFAQGFAAGAATAAQMENIPEPDMSALIAFVESKMVEEEVTMQPRHSDPAARKVVITMNGEDMAQVWQLIFDAIRTNAELMEMLRANITIEGGMTIEAAFDEAMEEMQELKELFPEPVPLEIYLDEKDEPVYATLTMTVAEESAPTGATATGKIGASGSTQEGVVTYEVSLEMNYARLTLNDQVTHAVNAIIKDEADTVNLSVNVIDGMDSEEVRVDMGDGETNFGVYVTHSAQTEEASMASDVKMNLVVTDPELSLNMGVKIQEKAQKNGVDAQAESRLALCLEEKELFTMNVQLTTGEPEAAFAPEDAIRLATVSDEDFQAWFVDLVNGLEAWLFSAAQALPASVLMLLTEL